MLPRTLAAAVAAALMLAVAPAARADLSLIDTTEPTGPGISLKHHKYLDASGWYDEQVSGRWPLRR